MTRILWLPEALDDVERLHDFLIRKDPAAVARAVRAILIGAGRLQELPNLAAPSLTVPIAVNSSFSSAPEPTCCDTESIAKQR